GPGAEGSRWWGPGPRGRGWRCRPSPPRARPRRRSPRPGSSPRAGTRRAWSSPGGRPYGGEGGGRPGRRWGRSSVGVSGGRGDGGGLVGGHGRQQHRVPQAVENGPGPRRGHVTPKLADGLEQDRHDVLGLLSGQHRAEAGEPGKVALAGDLGGAGLACDREAAEVEALEGRSGGAVAARDAEEPLKDRAAPPGPDVHRPDLLGHHRAALAGVLLAGGVVVDVPLALGADLGVWLPDLVTDVGPEQGAAVGDGGVHVGELQRGDPEVALADGHVHRVAGDPVVVRKRLGVLVVELTEDLRREGEAVPLTGQVDARVVGEAELVGGLLEEVVADGLPAAPEVVPDPVVVPVAGLGEGELQVDRAV